VYSGKEALSLSSWPVDEKNANENTINRLAVLFLIKKLATKKIYVVRHGETEYNRTGVVQGSGVNSALNDNGFKQADLFFTWKILSLLSAR